MNEEFEKEYIRIRQHIPEMVSEKGRVNITPQNLKMLCYVFLIKGQSVAIEDEIKRLKEK